MTSSTPQHLDSWASGAAYEPYVGRWSRLVAREVITWLAVPPTRRWLDGGCGTGAVTETILAAASPTTVTGVDSSAAYLAYARARIQDPRAAFELGDLQSLPFVDATFDAALSGLVLNFVSDQPRAVRELRARRPPQRHRGRLPLGLRRGNAVHALLLGRRRRARPHRP